MYISIDFNSDEALYLQLRNQIIRAIVRTELQEGENLPSVRDMADEIGINMHTVNKAYALLRQEGYLQLDRRRGCRCRGYGSGKSGSGAERDAGSCSGTGNM